MSEITIKESNQRITGWAKDINFEYEGERYSVILYWNIEDGYELLFKNNRTPKWVEEWEIDYQAGEDTLEYTLDSLTEEVIEARYL